MPERTRQFMEVPIPEGGRSQETGAERQFRGQQSESAVNTGTTGAPVPGKARKYQIINATNSGADYEPTRAQILAAQMAEEFYGTQVTFVHADVTTFKAIVQKLTGNDVSSSSSSKLVRYAAPADRAIASSDLRVSSRTASQKSSLFKHLRKMGLNSNNKGVEVQRLQLQDAATIATGQTHTHCCSVLSAIPSPVSPLTVYNEFENGSTSGDGSGGQGSAVDTGTQVHENIHFSDHRCAGSDEDDNLIDRSFTFPQLSIGKEETMLSRPKLLNLFPEAPVDR